LQRTPFEHIGRGLLASLVMLAAATCSKSTPAPASSPDAGPAPAPANGVFVEGTRLKAVYQQVDGAPPLLMGWYDTQLGADCSFRDVGLPDGRLVCFPVSLDVPTPTLFTDSACTQVLLEPFGGCGDDSFGGIKFVTLPTDGATCGGPGRLFPIGPALTSAPAALFSLDPVNGPPTCGPSTTHKTSDPFTLTLHTLGPEVSLDQLVSGTHSHDSGPGRIVPVSIVASDGSVQVAGSTSTQPVLAWDNERGELVSADFGGDLLDRWGPADQSVTEFGDAACSVPVITSGPCGGPSKEFATMTDAATGCGLVLAAGHQVGAPVPNDGALYYSYANQCSVGTAIDPKVTLVSYGAQIPATEYAEVTQARTGTGQVQLVRVGSADGPPTYGLGFFDSVHRWPCSPTPAADLMTRCLPTASWQLGRFFSDAACTAPLAFPTGSGPPACDAPAVAGRMDPFIANAPCGTVYGTHVYPLGDVYSGPIFLSADPGLSGNPFFPPAAPCTPIGTTDAPDGRAYEGAYGPADMGPALIPMTFHAVGAEIPPSELALVTTVRPK
jgi:hypothetical protein